MHGYPADSAVKPWTLELLADAPEIDGLVFIPGELPLGGRDAHERVAVRQLDALDIVFVDGFLGQAEAARSLGRIAGAPGHSDGGNAARAARGDIGGGQPSAPARGLDQRGCDQRATPTAVHERGSSLSR